MVRPGEEADEAIRIAKAWGCLCRPTVVRHWTQGDLLRVTLRHTKTCGYDPSSFFREPEKVDEEALAKQAAAIKKRRSKATRQANKAGKT